MVYRPVGVVVPHGVVEIAVVVLEQRIHLLAPFAARKFMPRGVPCEYGREHKVGEGFGR